MSVCVCGSVHVCGKLVTYLGYDDTPIRLGAAMEAYCRLQWAQAFEVYSQESGSGPKQ